MRMRSEQQTDLQPKNQEARCSQSKSILYQVLHFIKLTIAAATIIFLVVTLAIEIFRIELFIIAITCQVIWAHDKLWITLTGVLCIAGLFAIRRNRGVQKKS